MIKNYIMLFSLVAVALFIVVSTTTVVLAQEENNKKQIILNPNNIQELKAFGETSIPWYPENYPPEYLFDNLINSYSFWTQQGSSGFNLILKEKLEDQPICNVELGVLQPQNTPFSLAINDKKVANGTLNSETVQVKIGSASNDNCISNVNKISMNFTPSDRLFWTTLSEVKLFSDTKPEPPPVVLPGNITKFIITNSTVTIDLENSEVILKQPAAAISKQNPTTPIETTASSSSSSSSPPVEEDEDEDEDEDDKDGKKEKDNKN